MNDVSYKTGSYSEKKNALIGAIRAKLYGQYRYDFPPSKSEAQTLAHLEKMFDFPRTRRILYKKLLDAGADPNFKDDKGKTVLDYVLEERSHAADVEAAKLIQSYMN